MPGSGKCKLVAAPDANNKIGLDSKANSQARTDQLQGLAELSQVLLLDPQAYQKQYNSTTSGPSKMSNGQSSMDAAMTTSGSARLSNYKTQSFVSNAKIASNVPELKQHPKQKNK